MGLAARNREVSEEIRFWLGLIKMKFRLDLSFKISGYF
ncbi:unnamed protein product [Brassica oleracea var. botrytis]